jgi:hypothetical protein
MKKSPLARGGFRLIPTVTRRDIAGARYVSRGDARITQKYRLAVEGRDVSWDAGVLAISRTVKVGGTGTPKGDKARNVVIASYLLDILRDHRADQARKGRVGPLVFTSPTGCQLNRHNVRRRGHSVTLRDAALPSTIRLHDLRHTAATLWLASGQSIYFVQQQLGHKDIQTTIDLYGHPDQAAHRDAAERAAAWWRNGPLEGSSVPRLVPRAAEQTPATSIKPVPTGLTTSDAAS